MGGFVVDAEGGGAGREGVLVCACEGAMLAGMRWFVVVWGMGSMGVFPSNIWSPLRALSRTPYALAAGRDLAKRAFKTRSPFIHIGRIFPFQTRQDVTERKKKEKIKQLTSPPD